MANAGRRVTSRDFVLIERETAEGMRATAQGAPAQGARLGITASRRVGNAVARNRVKRRVREWFRRLGPERRRPVDWVVIARPGAAQRSSGETHAALTQLVTRLTRSARERR